MKECGGFWTESWKAMFVLTLITHFLQCIWIFLVWFSLFKCIHVWQCTSVCIVDEIMIRNWVGLIVFLFIHYKCEQHTFCHLNSYRYIYVLLLATCSWWWMVSVGRVGGMSCDMWDWDPTEISYVYESTAFRWRCRLYWRWNWLATMCNRSLSRYVYVQRNVSLLSTASNQYVFVLCVSYVFSNMRIPGLLQNLLCILLRYLRKITMLPEFIIWITILMRHNTM